jgi:hypothetical protein
MRGELRLGLRPVTLTIDSLIPLPQLLLSTQVFGMKNATASC